MPGIKDGPSTAKSQKFRWEDEGLIERLIEKLIKRLIERYEARPCLWDIELIPLILKEMLEKRLFPKLRRSRCRNKHNVEKVELSKSTTWEGIGERK